MRAHLFSVKNFRGGAPVGGTGLAGLGGPRRPRRGRLRRLRSSISAARCACICCGLRRRRRRRPWRAAAALAAARGPARSTPSRRAEGGAHPLLEPNHGEHALLLSASANGAAPARAFTPAWRMPARHRPLRQRQELLRRERSRLRGAPRAASSTSTSSPSLSPPPIPVMLPPHSLCFFAASSEATVARARFKMKSALHEQRHHVS